MIEQLKAIVGILYKPKSTLKNLPSNKLYVLAVLAPLYFGYARGMRTGSFNKLTEITGNKLLTFLLFIIISVVFIPLGALIMKMIIRIFGKRLTLFKLMNLYGYAYVPRLLISIPLSLYVNFLMPEDTKFLMMLGEMPSWMKIAAAVSGVVFLYCIALYFCGIVVSPSTPPSIPDQDSSVANKPLQSDASAYRC